ncbi:MAG: alpha/beta hydrolase [Treponema sp.]|jgi:acetyl esterase/lipase|nr:alpha/beta hydrolase [Treponema sp.]
MRKFTIGLLILLSLFFAAGCASTGKTAQEIRYTVHKDLSYGSHERNLVDISLPGDTAGEGVILFIHGGVWMLGGKENCPVFLDGFRDRFIVASMNHRYIDETTHINDLVDDVAAAVAYIREFALRNGADPGKLIIMGHSSGAHLSMLYAYKQQSRADGGTDPMPIAFCVDMAGPADLGDIAFLYNFKKMGWEKFFYQLAEKAAGHHIVDGDITGEGYSESGREVLAAISPLSFVTAGSPPTIIVHDVADTIVPYANSAALHSVFNVYGVDHYFMASYSGIGHLLGAKATRRGPVVYDKTLTAWIVRIMNKYIERYCR